MPADQAVCKREDAAPICAPWAGRREAVETQAKYSTLLKLNGEELSKNLRKWLGDPFLVKKWQPFLIPKMKTGYMKILKKEGRSWISRKLIDRELNRRK